MRQFEATPATIVAVFPDPVTAERVVHALRERGHQTHLIAADEAASLARARPTRFIRAWWGAPLAFTGALVAVLLEASIFAVPASIPTVAGGSIIAALVGSMVGLAAAMVVSSRSRSETSGGLVEHLHQGRPIVAVSVRDALNKERVRRSVRELGAIETLDLDGDATVAFARPFSDVDERLRAHCRSRYGADPRPWETMLPAYVFGWDRANRPDHAEHSFADAAADLEREWGVRHPERIWRDDADAVAEAWKAARTRPALV